MRTDLLQAILTSFRLTRAEGGDSKLCSAKSGLPWRGVRRKSVVIGEAVGPHAVWVPPPSSMPRLPACTPHQEKDISNNRESGPWPRCDGQAGLYTSQSRAKQDDPKAAQMTRTASKQTAGDQRTTV